MKRINHLLTITLLMIVGALPATATDSLKVMSFNIRYGAAKDGINKWENRKNLVLDTIKDSNPDLLGLQEVLGFQADFLKKNLTGYAFHGVGREDGKEKGEYVPLMYKTKRFVLERSGHFWFSETPDKPGSKSWDSSLPRMLSWVALRDLKNEEIFIFANAHYDHRGKVARLESAKLMRKQWESVEGDVPLVITGDFNTTEDGKPYAVLVNGPDDASAKLIDSYRVIHPNRQPDEASFGGFKGVRKGSRIDWILHSEKFTTRNATINYSQENGRYPSDHYPIEALLHYR